MSGHTLVIGSAGTGKSTLARLLKKQNVHCIDADYDNDIAMWKHKTTGETFPASANKSDGYHDWIWDIDRLSYLLSTVHTPLVVCGTANNRQDAYDLFNTVLVLAPSKPVVRQRLQTREDNSFGKSQSQLQWAMQNYDDILCEAEEHHFIALDTSHETPSDTLHRILTTLE